MGLFSCLLLFVHIKDLCWTMGLRPRGYSWRARRWSYDTSLNCVRLNGSWKSVYGSYKVSYAP